MIKIEYVDNKPHIIINNKKIHTFSKLIDGCVYSDIFDFTIEDIENVILKDIPSKIFLLNISFENEFQTKYIFDYLKIKKIDETEFTLELAGEIDPHEWNIKKYYPIFLKNIQNNLNRSSKAWCEFDTEGYYFNILVVINIGRKKLLKMLLNTIMNKLYL